MATNCTSEDMRDRRRTDRDQRDVLGWVASALRSERLLDSLRRGEKTADTDR